MPLWVVPGLPEGKMHACGGVWMCVGGGGGERIGGSEASPACLVAAS